jgi:hypothetical protein
VVDPKNYGTENDIVMLCRSLKIYIDAYISSLLISKNGESRCQHPMHFGRDCGRKILLLH